MPGGPINGVPWTGTLRATELFGVRGAAGFGSYVSRGKTDPSDPAYTTGIIVPTVLQIAADALSYWTSMTCLYDRYWSAEENDSVTLPICLFHVKKITSGYSNEVSKKRVILYEPQGDSRISSKEMSDSMRSGVMQTVVDNVVKNPKTYSMEIIVPFQPIGRYISEGIKTISDMIVSLSDMLGGGNTPEGVPYGFDGSLSSVFALLQTANTAAEFAGKLPGTDGVSFINMNSLEAMADSCRTLCMKMWTGYEYKYVTIVGMNYDKDPKEDSVYRGTLTLQEVPVLAITKPNALKENVIDRNWAVKAISAVQGALTVPLLNITGVRNAAGGGESDVDMIKGTLGV